ncbi:uncharacterized protein LOC110695942 [Chenopodium quinoa]|uniref:uncharacterized protein LOC110695942 n=1 Tax=Chenopodium quinoa TaxID=63459 RepID=UPI000B794D5F|nr:uncharacterized protein LOC110695942 [Chenopodium quinoa]
MKLILSVFRALLFITMASPNHPSQSEHGVHGTTLAPTSDGLGAVDINLSLSLSINSSSTLPSRQNQANPVIDQQSSHHHLDGARTRRSNFNIPFGLHAHSPSDSYPLQPRNNVNLNFFVGNSSSFNINLLNNNPISQFASNSPSAGSSSTPPIINIFNPASSHVQQPFLNLGPNQEPILNRYSEINGSPRFARLHSQYASPIVATGSGNTRGTYVTNSEQEIPTAISYLRQNIVSLSTHHGQPSNLCQRILDQSRTTSQHTMGLSLFNRPFRYRGEKYNPVPSFPSSILNSPNHQNPILVDGNGTLHFNSFNPQPNPTFPEIHSASEEVVGQASEPNNNNATAEPAYQARRTSMYRSHPYKKYGPYTCPKCHVVFENGNRYSAHTQIHYKDETPDERKKRRESKIRKREMHLANSADGITVMPGSLQQGEEPILTGSGQPRCVTGSATMVIKKEVD